MGQRPEDPPIEVELAQSAGQENCDGHPYDLMQEASELITTLRKEVADLKTKAALFDAVENAAGFLPEWWHIEISVEQGSGTIELFHNLDKIDEEFSEETLADSVQAAFDYAEGWVEPGPLIEDERVANR
jgi:hypothetical protein